MFNRAYFQVSVYRIVPLETLDGRNYFVKTPAYLSFIKNKLLVMELYIMYHSGACGFGVTFRAILFPVLPLFMKTKYLGLAAL